MLTREEVKNELLQRGVNPKMLVMPAVMERMYEIVSSLALDEMKEKMDSFIKVGENGNFTMAKNYATSASFSVGEDGKAVISGFPDADSIIHTNEAGIEIAYEDGDWMGRFSQISRKGGKVERGSGNNGTATLSKTNFLDTGSWSILSQGTRIEENALLDREKALASFDAEAEKVVAEYPQTREWYEKTREELEGLIQDNNDPEKRIERLSQENERLKAEKKDLIRRNGELTSKLSATLNFAETVKRSPVGKLFFRKQIEKLDGKEKSLPEGRDDR